MDNSKCLICEESCPQKGLSFFSFPKDESRLKTWMKEISPVLNLLNLNPARLKENGKICARHFKDKDFINYKRNSLVQNACPNLSSCVPTLHKKFLDNNSLGTIHINRDQLFQQENETNFSNQEKDTFQCGRCKMQFQQLSEFIDHKRSQCKVLETKTNNDVSQGSLQNSILQLENTFLISFDNKYAYTSEIDGREDDLIKIINDDSQAENEVVSYVINQNELLSKNQISALSGQLIIGSRLPETESVIVGNGDNSSFGNVILQTTNNTDSNGEVVLNCSLPNDFSTSSLVLSQNQVNESEINHIIVTEPDGKSVDNYLLDNSNNLYKMSSSLDEGQTQNLLHFFYERLPMENKGDSPSVDPDAKQPLSKPKEKLSCSYCGKTFEKPFNLQQHERVHTGERPFQCIVCGRAFSQKSNVRKHMMRHKVWPQAKQTLKIPADSNKETVTQDFLDQMNYSCQYCTLSFESYSLYKKHLSHHSNFKVYRCIQKGCVETFSDLDEFLSHSKIHSSAEFQCHICLKSFTSLGELGAHQYDHDLNGRDKKEIEVKLKCETCHAQFKTVESLKNHLAVDTHNYECVHCRSVFSSERFLRRHLATHLDPSQSKFKCPNCKKTFRTQKYLNNHMFVHVNEKPFNCEHCDKQFASKYRLKRHLAIHLNQHFECPFKTYLGCQKTFYRKDKLRDHLTTHSNCRIRSCQFCSKTFSSVAKLNQHVRKEHKTGKGRQVLRCMNCSQTFRKQKQLMQHHCTVGERKFRSNLRLRNAGNSKDSKTNVSNIEIFMVPYVSDSSGEKCVDHST